MRRGCRQAVVIGSGPNGLSAAIALAVEGWSVRVVEARAEVGGGVRSAELTLPGFLHDVCSAVHPLAAGSPWFEALPLAQHGLGWIHSPAPLAHPLDEGAVVLERSLEVTAESLGRDGRAWNALFAPLVARWDDLRREVLGPMRFPLHPLLLARFGVPAIRSAERLARTLFSGAPARALLAGMCAHSALPLDAPLSASFGVLLAVAAHAVGWPIPAGGSQRLADALVGCLRSVGGRLELPRPVESLGELPPAEAVLFDLTPRQVARIAGDALPPRLTRAFERYRYGPGVFKVDYALDGPIPWKDPRCARAATVHLGGTLEEIAASERMVSEGEHPPRPFVLLAQPSLFDPARAPPGKHTVWAYCHVPNGSDVDMSARIEAQIERFAPGFRERVIGRHTRGPRELERENPNCVGGDISGGSLGGLRLFTRPTLRVVPHALPAPGLFLCSSSTPPGPGVHGMCGYLAAEVVLRRFRRRSAGTSTRAKSR